MENIKKLHCLSVGVDGSRKVNAQAENSLGLKNRRIVGRTRQSQAPGFNTRCPFLRIVAI